MLPRDVPDQLGSLGRITRTDPPFLEAGMSSVVLDGVGNLRHLAVIPPRIDSLAVRPPPDWGTWFAAAGLDTSRFRESAPDRNPSYYIDARRTWRGTRPTFPTDTVVVEAGTYRGRPARFSVIEPWDPRDRFSDQVTGGQRTMQSDRKSVV